jgi:hypothetical protein
MKNLPIDIAAQVISPLGTSFQEIEEELKQNNVLQWEYNQVLIELTLGVKTFQEQLDYLKMGMPGTDTTAIKAVLDKHLSQLNETLKEYPKGCTFRMFFPECNPREYLSISMGQINGLASSYCIHPGFIPVRNELVIY